MNRPFFRSLALLVPLCLGGVRTPPSVAASEPAVEWFVLQLPAAAPRARPDAVEEIGLAALWRRGTPSAGQFEWELRFFGEDTRVSHVERWGQGAPRLAWREWRPRSGRTLSAELGAKGIVLVESGQRQAVRASLPTPEGARFPIAVLEAARNGTLGPGRTAWLDPLARAIEELSVRVEFSAQPQRDASGELVLERCVRLDRDDGTTAAEWTFRGTELWSARWQSLGTQARRVSATEWEARVARCGSLAGESAAER
ncbi:MAG: hypothetical protein FJ298_13815 [Planctomycetes bacterium]|nr:hypothetical protein [Planctomycetota bacterium]